MNSTSVADIGDDFANREFPMTDADFSRLADIAYAQTGIVLGEHKKNLVYSRIARRVRFLNLNCFAQYVDLIEDKSSQESDNFINAITTNLTSFFRENHHFEYLENNIFRSFKEKRLSDIRVWSAGCSTGEEPYSIAITAEKVFGRRPSNFKILATDLDSNVLNHGRQGIYEVSRVDDLDLDLKKQYFSRNSAGTQVKVRSELKEYIRFNRLNLLADWPMRVKFDVIFCRNVMIYFNKDTQRVLFERFAGQLKSGGYLIIGHSENLVGVNDRFSNIGRTMYRLK